MVYVLSATVLTVILMESDMSHTASMRPNMSEMVSFVIITPVDANRLISPDIIVSSR